MAHTRDILIRLDWIDSDSISDASYREDAKNKDTVIAIKYLVTLLKPYMLFLVTTVQGHYFLSIQTLFSEFPQPLVQLCYSSKFQGGESENLGVNIWNQPEAVTGKRKKGWSLWCNESSSISQIPFQEGNPRNPSSKDLASKPSNWLLAFTLAQK